MSKQRSSHKRPEKVEEESVITLREFKLHWILSDSIVVLVGRRRSGKSWLIRQIIHMLSTRGMPYGKIYSGTEHCNPFFRNFFPPLFIQNEFDEEDLAKVLDSQKKKVRKAAKKYNVQDGRCLENNMLLVFDDMLSQDNIWKKSQNFKKLFVEGRHYNILFVMSLQHVLGIPPAQRDNIDYAFLFANDGQNLRKLWENYAGVIESFDMFKKIFYHCTRNKGCMVINKTSSSEDLTDKVFFYKALDPGRFRFGTRSLWRLNDENYMSSDDEESSFVAARAPERTQICNIIGTFGTNGKKYRVQMHNGGA
jgi:hypothetical protein